MSYLSAQTHQAIINNPQSLPQYYGALFSTFLRDLAPMDSGDMTDSLVRAAFASVVAFDLKPYGPEPPKVDLPSLLAAPSLACDNYVRLAWYFLNILGSKATVTALGWDSGAVGNHAQMMVADNADTISAGFRPSSLLLDPTVGFIARWIQPADAYNELTQGHSLDPNMTASFARFNSYPGTFTNTVTDAVTHGKYKPRDALYFASSLNFFNNLPAEAGWPTPGAAKFQPR
jgi:hypothetical protein